MYSVNLNAHTTQVGIYGEPYAHRFCAVYIFFGISPVVKQYHPLPSFNIKVLSHYNALRQRVPTNEKLVQHVNVCWIGFKNVFYKLEERLNTLLV